MKCRLRVEVLRNERCAGTLSLPAVRLVRIAFATSGRDSLARSAFPLLDQQNQPA